MKCIKGFSCEISLNLRFGNNKTSLDVYTKSTLSGKPTSQLTNLPDYDSITSMCLQFEDFDYFDKTNNQKKLSGKVFLEVTRNSSNQEKLLLAAPTVLFPPKGFAFKQTKSNNADLQEARRLIFNEWNKAFIDAYDRLQLDSDASIKINNPPSPKKVSPIIFLAKYFPKSKVTALLGISILGLSAALLGLSVYSKTVQLVAQKNAIKSLDAEALAKQQDQQLNDAFLELGIDRSKLTSDLSCFVE